MSDNAARRLALEELLKEEEGSLATILQQIRNLQEEKLVQERFVGKLRNMLNGVNHEDFRDDAGKKEAVDPSAKQTIAWRIMAAMSANGGPMRLLDIVKVLTAGEASAPGSFRSSVSTAILRRSDLFVPVSRGVYDLTDAAREMMKSNAHGGMN